MGTNLHSPLLFKRARTLLLFAANVLLIKTLLRIHGDFDREAEVGKAVHHRRWHPAPTKKRGDPPAPCRPRRDASPRPWYDRKQPPTSMAEAGCLHFECSRHPGCDDARPTRYDGPGPPCCAHVMRDMARSFDDHMCRDLGLDYASAFGTLLGFRRTGRIIPWTADLDYIVPSERVADMVELWDARATGLAHLYQGWMNRMCVTRDFAGGRLARWTMPPARRRSGDVYNNTFPYIDIYQGSANATTHGEDSIYEIEGGCRYYRRHFSQIQRRWVYNESFAVNVPFDVDKVLENQFGASWRIPKDTSDGHGGHGTHGCPYGPR